MWDTMFFSLLLNIGLLVLIATLLTKIPVVRNMLLDDRHSLWNTILLALIFGMVSIISTYTGVRAKGAIVNTRVIGVLAAGLLGGPYVGMGAAVIGGAHRYLFDIGGFTAISCAISTFMEGMVGAAFSRHFKSGKMSKMGIFILTALVEAGQMAIILFISKPFFDALNLVEIIAFPMIVMNALGMIVFLSTFDMVFIEEDSKFAEKMRLALGIVEKSLPHLKKGLHSIEDMEEAAHIIFQSTTSVAVFITDTQKILGMKKGDEFADVKDQVILKPVLSLLHQGQPTLYDWADKEDPLHPKLKNYLIFIAPLMGGGEAIGSLTIIVKKNWLRPQGNLEFASELARLFSTQLELSHLDYQKKLRRRAEFQALQSQVNPHFLYNALNTISYVCRENPDRARELLLILSSYYRQTLENDKYMLDLHTELHYVMNYLELEKARFEEKLQLEIKVEEDINCMVPSFTLQPLVENAVRYGVDIEGKCHVTIQAKGVKDYVEISIEDRGRGFPEEIKKKLYRGEKYGGVGLENVYRRMKSIYGEERGLEIESSLKGTKIILRIPRQWRGKNILCEEGLL
ncbi:sensor histidine kinase [bacterium 1XD42-8]|nr:sensor histidine kinase [bacterium 1XD42-8]